MSRQAVESLLQKFAAQELIEVKGGEYEDNDRPTLVTFADHSKLSAMMGAVSERKGQTTAPGAKKRRIQETDGATSSSVASSSGAPGEKKASEPHKKTRKNASHLDLEIESLLSQQSTKERQSKKVHFCFFIGFWVLFQIVKLVSEFKCPIHAVLHIFILFWINYIAGFGSTKGLKSVYFYFFYHGIYLFGWDLTALSHD